MDELSERSGQAYAARSRDDLEVLVADLPTAGRRLPRPGPSPAPAPSPPSYGPPSGGYPAPGYQAPTPSRGVPAAPAQPASFVGIMRASRAKGRWPVPPEVSAVAFWGTSIIDLREAEIPWPVVTIKAIALMGGVDVIVPRAWTSTSPASC